MPALDPADKFAALAWAVGKLEGTSDAVELLFVQYLREMRDVAKREAGR